jgi:hypothetical protein
MLDGNQKIAFFGFLPGFPATDRQFFQGRFLLPAKGFHGRGVMPEDVWYTGSISEINA